MKAFLPSFAFFAAFLVAVPVLVEAHTFFAGLPFDPLLDESATTLIIYVEFGFSALGAALALSLRGIDFRHRIFVGGFALVVLLTIIEAYLLAFAHLPDVPGPVFVAAWLVLNLVLAAGFLRVALAFAN